MDRVSGRDVWVGVDFVVEGVELVVFVGAVARVEVSRTIVSGFMAN